MGIINYHRTGDFIEITVRDFSNRKIESLNCDSKDKKKYAYILSYLKDKYGFEPMIDVPAISEEPIDLLDKKDKKESSWWD